MIDIIAPFVFFAAGFVIGGMYGNNLAHRSEAFGEQDAREGRHARWNENSTPSRSLSQSGGGAR